LVLEAGSKRKRALPVRHAQPLADEAAMRKRVLYKERHKGAVSTVMRAAGILPDDSTLGGNQHGAPATGAIVKFSNGAVVSAKEYAELKTFLRLDTSATPEDVAAVAAVFSHQHRREQRIRAKGASETPAQKDKGTIKPYGTSRTVRHKEAKTGAW
jgi:hypothetical protein